MNLCWSPDALRPDMTHLHNLLSHLCENVSLSVEDAENITDFEIRWNQLNEQCLAEDHSIAHLGNTTDLRFVFFCLFVKNF